MFSRADESLKGKIHLVLLLDGSLVTLHTFVFICVSISIPISIYLSIYLSINICMYMYKYMYTHIDTHNRTPCAQVYELP